MCFRVLSSLSPVLCQVFSGFSLLHLPSGIKWRAVQVIFLCSFHIMWLVHMHHLLLMMIATHSRSLVTSRQWWEMIMAVQNQLLWLAWWRICSGRCVTCAATLSARTNTTSCAQTTYASSRRWRPSRAATPRSCVTWWWRWMRRRNCDSTPRWRWRGSRNWWPKLTCDDL